MSEYIPASPPASPWFWRITMAVLLGLVVFLGLNWKPPIKDPILIVNKGGRLDWIDQKEGIVIEGYVGKGDPWEHYKMKRKEVNP